MTSRFLEALADRVVLGDGAMGTELLARGGRWTNSSAELNLDSPDLVLSIHREYVEAGAEILRTNTFTANSLRMDGDRAGKAIVEAGALARKAAGPARFVAGSVGPVSDLPGTDEEYKRVYAQQCRRLAEAGCDLLFLETFLVFEDLCLAVEAAEPLGVPIVAHTVHNTGGVSLEGHANIAAFGLNCLEVDRCQFLSELPWEAPEPISLFPSAGRPGACYAPEPFGRIVADYASNDRIRLVGGCCGTTPSHIRALGKAMQESRK